MAEVMIDLNAGRDNPDWLHSLSGYEDELKIHEELAKEYERERKKQESDA